MIVTSHSWLVSHPEFIGTCTQSHPGLDPALPVWLNIASTELIVQGLQGRHGEER